MAYKKRVKQSTQRRKAVRFALEIDKDKWVIGAKEISELREDLKGDVCPVCKQPYGTGMNQPVLDHSHSSGRCRQVICASCNLFEGRLTKYFNKLLKKKDVPVEDVLTNIVEYLKQSKDIEPILHGAMIEAEKKRVSRWRIETLYDKLVEKGLTLNAVTDYTKHQITEVWLNQFIKELESTI